MKAESRDHDGHQGAGELVSPETVAMCNRSRNEENMRTTTEDSHAEVVPRDGAADDVTGTGETEEAIEIETSDQVNPMTETKEKMRNRKA